MASRPRATCVNEPCRSSKPRWNAARGRSSFEIACPRFIATASTERRLHAALYAVRSQLAFYGSTPSYCKVLDLEGWTDVAEQLHLLSRRNDPAAWAKMGTLITDDVLETFAVVAAPDDVAGEIHARFGGVDRFSFSAPYEHEPDVWATVLRGLRIGPV